GNRDVTGVAYDNSGRRTGTTIADYGSSSWSWDSLGRLQSATDGGSTTAYRRDLNGNLTGIAYPGGNCGSSPVRCVTRTYDDASRWVSVTDWHGRTVEFPPDANGNHDQLLFHTDPQSPSTTQFSNHITFDNADRMTGVDY